MIYLTIVTVTDYFEPRQDVVTDLFFRTPRLYIGYGDYRVKIWDLRDRVPVEELSGFWEVRSVFAEDDYLFVGSLRETIDVIELQNFTRVKELRHDLGVLNLFADDFRLFSCSHDGTVKVFSLDDFSELVTLEGHSERATCCFADKGLLYVGDGFMQGGKVTVWDLKDFSKIKVLDTVKSKRIQSVYSDGKNLFVGHGGSPKLSIWDRKTLVNISVIDSFSKDVIRIRGNAKSIFAASTKEILKIDRKTLKVEAEYEIRGYPLSALSVSDTHVFFGNGPKVIALLAENLEKDFEIIRGDQDFPEEIIFEGEEQPTPSKFNL